MTPFSQTMEPLQNPGRFKLHGGSVCVESEGPGKGSKFTVRLPQLVSEPLRTPDSRTSAERPSNSVQPLRLLVVDDNADAANTLSMLLEASGHEVFTEYAASRAIDRAQQTSPQVCLLDIGLPELDGYEVARRLRAIPEMVGAVLIAVTGYGQEHDKRKSIEAGFDYHLVKPVSIEDLLTVIAQIRIP